MSGDIMKDISKNTQTIFSLLNIKGIGPAKIHSIWREAERNKYHLSDLLPEKHIVDKLLKPEHINQLNNNEEIIKNVFSRIETESIQVINYFEEDYPLRLKTLLGEKAPLLLYVKGNRSILEKKSIGFCGSRKASPKGIATANDCAEQLAQKGININSGYATGIDMATHRTALESSGTTTIVLPEGIFHFRIKKDLEDVWDWERVCVISEFLPGIPWSVRNAMQRNTTICSLSLIMILIEAGATGGSIEAGKTALDLGIPLLAPTYEGMPESAVGNRQLLEQGAVSIFRSKTTGRANLNYVLNFLNKRNHVMTYTNFQQEAQMVHENDQLDLFCGEK
jgi:DNA processing protein